MSPEWVGGGIVAFITVLGSWAVARTSARSTQRVAAQNVAGQIESSRLQAEQNAFERAEATLGRTIDRQAAEIRDIFTLSGVSVNVQGVHRIEFIKLINDFLCSLGKLCRILR